MYFGRQHLKTNCKCLRHFFCKLFSIVLMRYIWVSFMQQKIMFVVYRKCLMFTQLRWSSFHSCFCAQISVHNFCTISTIHILKRSAPSGDSSCGIWYFSHLYFDVFSFYFLVIFSPHLRVLNILKPFLHFTSNLRFFQLIFLLILFFLFFQLSVSAKLILLCFYQLLSAKFSFFISFLPFS